MGPAAVGAVPNPPVPAPPTTSTTPPSRAACRVRPPRTLPSSPTMRQRLQQQPIAACLAQQPAASIPASKRVGGGSRTVSCNPASRRITVPVTQLAGGSAVIQLAGGSAVIQLAGGMSSYSEGQLQSSQRRQRSAVTYNTGSLHQQGQPTEVCISRVSSNLYKLATARSAVWLGPQNLLRRQPSHNHNSSSTQDLMQSPCRSPTVPVHFLQPCGQPSMDFSSSYNVLPLLGDRLFWPSATQRTKCFCLPLGLDNIGSSR